MLVGCSWFDNQTTYFNTYYNIKRIIGEIQAEFEYQDENKRTKPRVLVPPIEGLSLKTDTKNNTYQFLKPFMIERQKLQPVVTKVDSILIKGSKILATHPKSNYVEGSIYYMGEAYFMKSEWIPSQQKCIELIERFPDGDFSPDAHLLLAKDYLFQKKIALGKTALSKCIDVAWYKDRYDILSEVYRIQAEMALEDGETEKAVNPYKQAIAQCEDSEQRAKWQVDLASIYYRLGLFEKAEKAYEDVKKETPDPLAQFEAKLYRASSLAQLGRFEEAEKLFVELEDDRKYTEWTSFIQAERLGMERLRKPDSKDPALLAQEKKADTSFVGRPELMAQSFQKGMDYYKKKNYEEAMVYFAKAKVIRTPVYDVANKYFTLIKQLREQNTKVNAMNNVIIEREELRDSVVSMRMKEVYALGRVHEQMDNLDSALYYYRMAYDSTKDANPERSKYLFAQTRVLAETNPEVSDSLLEVLAERYPKSTFGKEAKDNLGLTEVIAQDEAEELYKSGTSFRQIKEYGYAERQFTAILTNHPQSPYAAKALYALGWMYEKDIDNNDSALHFYGKLLEQYPRSDYAREIRPSVEYALAKQNGTEINDSLLLRDLDKDLQEKAKAGEQNVLQQLLQKNQDALQVGGLPSINLPNIDGVTPPGGGNINEMINNQLKPFKDKINGASSVPIIPPPTPVPADTTTKKP